MKKSVFVLIALLVASLAAFVGCFGSSKQTLHLYCWADYISPELIADALLKASFDENDKHDNFLVREGSGTIYDSKKCVKIPKFNISPL